MSTPIDPLDRALHALRSRRASSSGSFSQQLEDRLMQEFQRRQAGPARRRVFWIAVATVAVLAGTLGYAAKKGWTDLPVTLYVGEDGVITDENGAAIGLSIDHEDGSSTSVIIPNDGGYIELHNDQSVKGRSLKLDIGEPDTQPAGQSPGDQRQSATNTADPH